MNGREVPVTRSSDVSTVRAGGRGRPTLEDVAVRAGVSRALVSIVVRGAPGASEQTRARVLKVAAELGYRPDATAQLLARRRSRLFGVTVAVRDPFHADVVERIYAAADGTGYDVALSALTTQRDQRRAVETLLDYRCEAVFLLSPESRAPWLGSLAKRVPVVAIGAPVREPYVDVVRTAEATGMAQAVDHLVSLGHERIVHVDGLRAPGAADRRRGYRAAMRRHRLSDRAQVISGGPSEEDGVAAAESMLVDGKLPTAVLCYNDRSAVGFLDAMARAGVAVPADLSVVGYDDSQLARLSHVGLTSVAQDVDRMATLAVERAVARLDSADQEQTDSVLPPHLVVRRTTAPPRPNKDSQ